MSYTVKQSLTLAKNVLNEVEKKLKSQNKSNSVSSAVEKINFTLTSLDQNDLEALVEYQLVIENIVSDDNNDPKNKPNLDNF